MDVLSIPVSILGTVYGQGVALIAKPRNELRGLAPLLKNMENPRAKWRFQRENEGVMGGPYKSYNGLPQKWWLKAENSKIKWMM